MCGTDRTRGEIEESERMERKVKVPAKLALAVVAACLVSFCGLITETAVNIAFPVVMETFGVSTKTVQWLTTGNLLVVAMITPLSALLTIGILLFAVLGMKLNTGMIIGFKTYETKENQ